MRLFFRAVLDVNRLKKVLDKILFLCYNMITLIEDERPINEI